MMEYERGTTEDWETRLAEYMLGGMHGAEAAQFERELNECIAHAQLARQYTQVVGWLGTAADPAEPPTGHKERLLSRISVMAQEESGSYAAIDVGEPQQTLSLPEGRAPIEPSQSESIAARKPVDLTYEREKRRTVGAFAPLFTTVAAALLLFVGIWGWMQSRDKELLQQEVILARQSLTVPERFRVVPLAAQQVPPEFGLQDVSAVALVDTNSSEAHLFAQGLRPLSSQQVYEMWLLSPDPNVQPLAAGTFNAEDDGEARSALQVPSGRKLGDYAGVAVSVERAPGVTVSEGRVVLVGTWPVQ